MNMNAPTTGWDRATTNAELGQHYGVEGPRSVRSLMIDVITKTVRTVSHKALSLPYVRYSGLNAPKVLPYPLMDVVADYGTEPQCMDALMTVIEKSDCPHVAAWRKAIAERFADSNAEEVEEMQA